MAPYHCIVSLRLGHTRWHVAATHQGKKSPLVYRLGDKLRDTLQQQIALCVMGNCCENLCFCNRVLLPQQVAQIQPGLILYYFLWWQNSVERNLAPHCLITQALVVQMLDSTIRWINLYPADKYKWETERFTC